MHPTLEDRSISIELKRKLKTETVVRIPKDPTAYAATQRKCARWAMDNIEALRKAAPKLPDELNDRARDSWEPLLAIAEACGAGWALRARRAAVMLSGDQEDEEFGVQLLTDLRYLFHQERGANLSSKSIEHALSEMEHRPWPEFRNGKPITTRQIAALLKPFKIIPRQVRVRDGKQVNGYTQDQLRRAFERYLPQAGEFSSDNSDKPSASSDYDEKVPLTSASMSEHEQRANMLKNNDCQSRQRAARPAHGKKRSIYDVDLAAREKRAREAAQQVSGRRLHNQAEPVD
jgi:hypothetical protein